MDDTDDERAEVLLRARWRVQRLLFELAQDMRDEAEVLWDAAQRLECGR
jgi:hypothetical protein